MPETYGLPEPEPEPIERVQRAFNEVVAGQGVVRRAVLYIVASVGIVLAIAVDGVIGLTVGTTALVALLLLCMTDGALA